MLTLKFLMPLLLLTATVAHAAEPEGRKLTTLQWTLSLSEDGKITALEASGSGIEALRQRLEPIVRQWEFVPGQVAGKPAATQTLLSVQLALTPSANSDELAVAVVDARTGGGVATTVAPRISRSSVNEMLRSGRPSGASLVTVEVSYDATGKVLNTKAAADSEVQSGALLADARKAIERWTYVPERVARVGVPGKLIVPICFTMSTSASPSNAGCRWTQPSTGAVVEQGQGLALDSSVKIKTDVTASML